MRRPIPAAVRQLTGALGTLLGASVILFAGSAVLPGDAASSSLGASATPDEVARVRAEYGLDRPLPTQFLSWIGRAVRGDLGHSLYDRKPVLEVVTEPFLDTALLVGITVVVTLVAATALGLACGLRPGGRLDRVLSGAAVAVVSVPQFVIAVLLVLGLGTGLGLLPAVSLVPFGGTPLDRPEILVLPVLSLSFFAAAWASRIVRAAVVDANAAPYVEAARLAGLPERRVLWRHLLPATVAPCAQTFAWLVAALFGGTAVVERVFNYPGLSETMVGAVRHHDTPVLEGVGLLLAGVTVVCLLLADALAVLATPRLRSAS
ncbi:peptide/nickel transport system permease protein [Streptomyces sp. 1114.5]|uniref:ABC transporter permease n=1 Tax=unclassified Streptomyces TaxID=2593676 RepID=UPI000BC9A145|nr:MULTISPECIES: ABC transporter permease [unclassified Streptomyces]RKT17044.1 peptide/nickel transport system permease protein [Streptomyces sp. 1114.5]SOB83255.1 peptide/nickel transport system permease protein [Streptomyces sp. 1331.2]